MKAVHTHELRALACALALGLAGGASGAEPRSGQGFDLDPERVAAMARGGLYAAWNPHDAKSSNQPGMKIAFFGTAPACNLGRSDGPVAALAHRQAEQSRALTGITAQMHWAPSAQTEHCDPSVRGRLDDSMVVIDPHPANGGVGLYTGTGPGMDGRPGFMGPFAQGGQDGKGANTNIEGTFVNFREAWQGQKAMLPWEAGSRQSAVRMRSTMSVREVAVGEPRGARPIQAKQQMTYGFINRECMRERSAGERRPCQLKYLFTIAIYRSGVRDWQDVTWFRGARVLFDAGQGGIPVVDGPIMETGRATTHQATGLVLYSSGGAPTQHDRFSDKAFEVRIGWDEFLNGLKLIASTGFRKPLNAVTAADVAGLFGSRWDDPGSWALMQVTVGQEVSNPEPLQRTAIGGSFRTLSVSSRP